MDEATVREPWNAEALSMVRGPAGVAAEFSPAAMIPGEMRAPSRRPHPEALRTIRAWVCATPHCRYRESA